MLIKYKDCAFNTSAITLARKEKPLPRAIPVLTIKFVDGTEELFTGEDSSKVWRLLCAVAGRSAGLDPATQD